MSESLNDLFNVLANEVNLYTKENEKVQFYETLVSVKSDELVKIIENLLPDKQRNSYTLEKDVVNIIDFISSRLLPGNKSITRSEVVNEILKYAKSLYYPSENKYQISSKKLLKSEFNKDYSQMFFGIIRGEVEESIIKKFGFDEENGKQGIRLDLTLDNLEFIREVQDLYKNRNISQTLNDILKALLRKKI